MKTVNVALFCTAIRCLCKKENELCLHTSDCCSNMICTKTVNYVPILNDVPRDQKIKHLTNRQNFLIQKQSNQHNPLNSMAISNGNYKHINSHLTPELKLVCKQHSQVPIY